MKSLLAKSINGKPQMRRLLQLTADLNEAPWWVEDNTGVLLFGEITGEAEARQEIWLEGGHLGTVIGGNTPVVRWVAGILHTWLQQEAEKKQLGAETLHLYKEINLIFSFAEKLSAAVSPIQIAQLTLQEAQSAIQFDEGWFFLIHNKLKRISTLAVLNRGVFRSDSTLPTPPLPAIKIVKNGRSEILTVTGDENAMLPTAALKIGQRILGGIVLQKKEATAADLKLLCAMATQAAAAIENSIQHEISVARALKEQREKLTLELALKDPFFKKVMAKIETQYADPQFSVALLADEMHISISQLQRKIAALTDISPLQIIRDIRLRKAKELLRTTDKNISEIAFEAGFNDPSYFTRIFSKEFGGAPSEWKEAQINQGIQAIQENKIMKMYVDEGVLEFMEGKSEEQLMINQMIEATVVFVDICGFSAISEKEQPHVVIQMLNQYFDLIVPSIIDAGGKVDKFIGDAVLAVFQDEDHLIRAVQSSIAIHQTLQNVDSGRLKVMELLKVTIGLNTGELVAGNVGSAALRRFDFTVIGDVVNTAQRLQSVARPGQILITESTLQKLPRTIACRELGDFTLKNKSRAIAVYEVLY